MEVISDLEVKRSSDNTCKVLCPWHDDHDPSLTIYQDTNSCHCFVCGQGGTAEFLYAKLNNIPWSEFKKTHRPELDLTKKPINYRDEVNLQASRIFFDRMRREPCQVVFQAMKEFDDHMAGLGDIHEQDVPGILAGLTNGGIK